ncbi:hypothetical protein [Acidocella facilis]|uniref:hypothetical protein n=1 Tax=Acidocella facilis TaxID=525 RepID=UPI000555B916|nr:hypothetical protein [Acidocella facilis]
MVRQSWQGFVFAGVAGVAAISACAMAAPGPHVTDASVQVPTPVTPRAAAKPAAPQFSVQTPIDKIAADARGKAVLNRDMPGLISDPRYELFSSMSLSQLASLSGGRLTQSDLKKVNTDLAELSPGQ